MDSSLSTMQATTQCDDVGDIEDLVSPEDPKPKERYMNRKSVTVRARKRDNEELQKPVGLTSIIPGTQTIFIKSWGCTHNSSDSEYMAGQLSAYGYKLTDDKYKADLWLLNSCTVKNPSEQHFRNEIAAGQELGKALVLAGCVPQGAPRAEFLHGLSVLGVQQIDRVVEVVEETLKGVCNHSIMLTPRKQAKSTFFLLLPFSGHSVRLLGQKRENGKKLGGASLLLPKVRKNPLIEIIPINTGCLNQCTYCKTKHARGELGSYPPEEIVARAVQSFEEGVCELWLTSEDTGTYGRDIGTSLPELLWQLVDVIPDGCMMRLGMTNPPYILEHLEEVAKILSHPRVYSFMHVPVQSGSDAVLADMKREYCRADFEQVVDFLTERIPGMTIATDIICGFPTETEEDFAETMNLCDKYKFPSLFINQFFPRPGTPAALMTRVPAQEVKKRTKKLTELFQSYKPYENEVGMIHKVLVTEVSHDKKHYVGHTKSYAQVLVPQQPELIGKLVAVKITSSSKHSMMGEPISCDVQWPSPGLIPPLHQGQLSGICNVQECKTSSSPALRFSFILLAFAVLARLLWLMF